MSTSINFDSNFTDKLSANQVETTIEEGDESFKDLPLIDKTEKDQGKCLKFLKVISLGQYKTPLYFRNKENYSSVTGGVITLICVSVFVVYAFWLILSVFNKEQWILQVKSQKLSYMMLNGDIYEEKCDDLQNPCKRMTLEDYVNAYYEQNLTYQVSYDQADWPQQESSQCGTLGFQLLIQTLNKKPEVKILQNLTKNYFKNDPLKLFNVCYITLDKNKIFEELKKQDVDFNENALLGNPLQGFPEYFPRFFFIIKGLNQRNQISLLFNENARVSQGGLSSASYSVTSIPSQSIGYVSQFYVEFNQYQSYFGLYFSRPQNLNKTFKFNSFYSSPSQQVPPEATLLYMIIHQDIEIYNYFPSGFIEAFSKLGGLLALLNIGLAINFVHKRWFVKEINQIIAQSKIIPVKNQDEDEQEGGKKRKTQTQVDTIYSIEYYNKLIERLQQVEEDMRDMKQVLQQKKND